MDESSPFFPFCFEGPIVRWEVGISRVVHYSVLMLPPHIEASIGPVPPRFRVQGEVADMPIDGAFVPTGDGRRYLQLSPRLLKAAGIAVGSVVEMRFRLDDPERVTLPQELEARLSRDATFRRHWVALSAGKQRAVAHHVASVKGPAAREKRLDDARVMAVEFGGDVRRWSGARKGKS